MTIQVAQQSLENLTVLRGKRLPELIEKMALPLPKLFRYENLVDQNFIANLGEEEILINHAVFNKTLLEEEQYAFQRGDVIFTLSGDWRSLMSEICIYDFRQARPGDFSMVLIAGVGVWMLIPDDNASLVIGCDPTYGHYLMKTLQHQIKHSLYLNNGQIS